MADSKSDKPYVCKYCGTGYTREKTLAVHMCEKKRRALQKNEKRVQLGMYAYIPSCTRLSFFCNALRLG